MLLDRIARSPSATALSFAAAFIGGVAAHAFDEKIWSPGRAIFLFAALAGVGAAVFFRRARLRFVFGVVCCFFAAVARYDSVLPMPTASDLPGSMRTFRGAVVEAPRVGVKQTVIVADSEAGRLELRLPFAGAVRRGDLVEWNCKPRPLAPGSADANAAIAGIKGRCFLREPPRIVSAAADPQPMDAARDWIRARAAEILPEPESSLLLGILIGDRDGLPPELAAAFRASGTSHILAVSGYNVTKVIEILVLVFALMFIPRRSAALAAVAAIFLFSRLTGDSASVVRAAVMGSAGQFARAVGRRNSSANSLVFAAAAMLAADPLLLAHDIGFDLSFAAVAGLFAFGSEFGRLLPAWIRPEMLRRILAETFAATLATLPLILFAFGTLALAGPLANVLALPLVPAAMASGAAAILLAAVHPLAAVPAAALAWATLRAMILVVEFAGGLPLNLPLRADFAGMCLMYGWIAVLWLALSRAERARIALPSYD